MPFKRAALSVAPYVALLAVVSFTSAIVYAYAQFEDYLEYLQDMEGKIEEMESSILHNRKEISRQSTLSHHRNKLVMQKLDQIHCNDSGQKECD